MIPHNLRYLKQALDLVRRVNSTADDILLKSDMTAQEYDKFLVDIQIYGAYEALHLATRLLTGNEIERLAFALAASSTTISRKATKRVRSTTETVDIHGLV